MLPGSVVQMTAAELTIDHVTAAGRDLDHMRAALAAVGIRSEYGGPHNNHATQMAITSFPDGSYLELIALQANPDPKALAAHYWSNQMQGDAGPSAWAVRPRDLAAEVKRLQAAGVTVHDPVRAGRDRPDGFHLDWETANTGDEPNGTFFPFMIHDFTPREKRAFPSGKPTTDEFTGVKRVLIVVRDLPAAVKRYRDAYALPAPEQQEDPGFGAKLAAFSGTPAVLAQPSSDKTWLAARLRRFGEGPCAFILGARGARPGEKTTWFGAEISWADAARLGWHLGFLRES